jgi:CrcB protein
VIGAWPRAQVFAVAMGSAVGGLARWLVGLWLNARWAGFPLGTLLVNCVGGLLIAAHLFGSLARAALGYAALNALLD